MFKASFTFANSTSYDCASCCAIELLSLDVVHTYTFLNLSNSFNEVDDFFIGET